MPRLHTIADAASTLDAFQAASLALAISPLFRSRQQTAHGSMVDALAAKYGVSGGDEPSEEAFAAARQRHEARVKSKGAAEGRRSAKGGVQKKRGAGAKA